MQLARDISEYLSNYQHFDEKSLSLLESQEAKTQVDELVIEGTRIQRFVNEFWTAKQRQSSSLHEISYRACFKGQLPRFFINWLSKKEDVVYDPFSGRGTTALEAALLGRRVIANDINPLSEILCKPRLNIPNLRELEERLYSIQIDYGLSSEIDLSMFYHEKTLAELVSIRKYLIERKDSGSEDAVDQWIRMVATNRLTGHSAGFFSVYTLPPNQAVSQNNQIKINEKRKQTPEYRDTRKLILKKTKSLLRNLSPEQASGLRTASESAVFYTEDARKTTSIKSKSVQLTVTSPPFLNIVNYAQDNWLRCWFNSIKAEEVSSKISIAKTIKAWEETMREVFTELYRISKENAWVAFEVGEVRKGKVKLDEYVVPLGIAAGFECQGIVVNMQEFTKTANIWGVSNNKRGTNSNRIVLFRKS